MTLLYCKGKDSYSIIDGYKQLSRNCNCGYCKDYELEKEWEYMRKYYLIAILVAIFIIWSAFTFL